MAITQLVPWWAKMGAKVLLTRMPVDYQFWRRVNLFEHGQMDRPDYAIGVVRSHLASVGWPNLVGRTIVELGPGDSLSTAVIAKALGVNKTILIDTGAYAESNLTPYRQLADCLTSIGLTPPSLNTCLSLADMLDRCNAVYLTNGLSDIKTITSHSVDLVFSQAVLEHVRKGELPAMLREMLRITKPDGVGSHRVDLKDHLN